MNGPSEMAPAPTARTRSNKCARASAPESRARRMADFTTRLTFACSSYASATIDGRQRARNGDASRLRHWFVVPETTRALRSGARAGDIGRRRRGRRGRPRRRSRSPATRTRRSARPPLQKSRRPRRRAPSRPPRECLRPLPRRWGRPKSQCYAPSLVLLVRGKFIVEFVFVVIPFLERAGQSLGFLVGILFVLDVGVASSQRRTPRAAAGEPCPAPGAFDDDADVLRAPSSRSSTRSAAAAPTRLPRRAHASRV